MATCLVLMSINNFDEFAFALHFSYSWCCVNYCTKNIVFRDQKFIKVKRLHIQFFPKKRSHSRTFIYIFLYIFMYLYEFQLILLQRLRFRNASYHLLSYIFQMLTCQKSDSFRKVCGWRTGYLWFPCADFIQPVITQCNDKRSQRSHAFHYDAIEKQLKSFSCAGFFFVCIFRFAI